MCRSKLVDAAPPVALPKPMSLPPAVVVVLNQICSVKICGFVTAWVVQIWPAAPSSCAVQNAFVPHAGPLRTWLTPVLEYVPLLAAPSVPELVAVVPDDSWIGR